MDRASCGGRLDLLLDKRADVGDGGPGLYTVEGGWRSELIVARFGGEWRQFVRPSAQKETHGWSKHRHPPGLSMTLFVANELTPHRVSLSLCEQNSLANGCI